MVRIATLLAIVACLTIVGCQPPAGTAGPTKEEYDALKTQVETLVTDLTTMQASMDSFIEQYNMHIAKYHKGGTSVPTTPGTGGGVKPPTQK